MSNVRGRIAVDVQFTDSTTSEGVQSLKSVTLQDAAEYTTGKVAIVTGTCGTSTAASSIDISSLTYKDSSGNAVSFSTLSRAAMSASNTAFFETTALPVPDKIVSCSPGSVGVGFNSSPAFKDFRVRTVSGTASYTLVLYGS